MTKDPVPLKAVHHIEFWVGNAKQAAHFYRTAFGFNQIAYSGLETGNREKASYVLEQGKVRLIFSTPLSGNNGIASHIKQHGDGVKVVALWVDDARQAYKETTSRGAKSYMEPKVDTDENGEIVDWSGSWDTAGGTEFTIYGFDGDSLMIMLSDAMRIAFVTGHIPLSEVANSLSENKIESKIEQLSKSLIQDFGISKPKIAVIGLNPHAGEDGILGGEEKEIILPAIKKAKQKNILAFGPYSADSFFTKDNLQNFDGVLAMYHDQGLTPFKTLSFSEGVNYTAGLSIVRTSPVHGTAYDIAGKNCADEISFRNAIYMACGIYKKRQEYKALSANPLQKQKA